MSMGKYYVVMQRVFRDVGYKEYHFDDTDGGKPVKIIDSDPELARQDAWDRTLRRFMDGADDLNRYSLGDSCRIPGFDAAFNESTELRVVWVTRAAWGTNNYRLPATTSAAFWEALRPAIEGFFYYVEEVEM